MTAIAYCNGVMACDSSYIGDDGLRDALATKIVRLSSGALLGGSGEADDRDVIELFDKAKTPKQFPSRKALADLNMEYVGILVLPNGRVYKIDIDPADGNKPANAGIWECNRGIAATGSGGHLALGNMHATASAIEAIKAACRFDPNCALPVHWVELKQGGRKRKAQRRG